MWPTYYIPGLARITTPVQDCWDYLVGSGTTERGLADGILDDPDIVFPVVAGRTYRVLGKIAFVMGEITTKKGGSPRIAWSTTGDVEVMLRSAYLMNPTLSPTPGWWAHWPVDRTEDDWTDTLDLPEYPDGETRPFHDNLFVDMHITNVSASGNVVFRWGCVGTFATGNSRVRLTTDTLVVVKEYLPP